MPAKVQDELFHLCHCQTLSPTQPCEILALTRDMLIQNGTITTEDDVSQGTGVCMRLTNGDGIMPIVAAIHICALWVMVNMTMSTK